MEHANDHSAESHRSDVVQAALRSVDLCQPTEPVMAWLRDEGQWREGNVIGWKTTARGRLALVDAERPSTPGAWNRGIWFVPEGDVRPRAA
jgi:hypothetical protein